MLQRPLAAELHAGTYSRTSDFTVRCRLSSALPERIDHILQPPNTRMQSDRFRLEEELKETDMQIGILGTGIVGQTLGLKLVQLGHPVT